MKNMKWVLAGIVLVAAIIAAMAFLGSGCYFSDAETSYDNTFTAGTWTTPTPTPTPAPSPTPMPPGGEIP